MEFHQYMLNFHKYFIYILNVYNAYLLLLLFLFRLINMRRKNYNFEILLMEDQCEEPLTLDQILQKIRALNIKEQLNNLHDQFDFVYPIQHIIKNPSYQYAQKFCLSFLELLLFKLLTKFATAVNSCSVQYAQAFNAANNKTKETYFDMSKTFNKSKPFKIDYLNLLLCLLAREVIERQSKLRIQKIKDCKIPQYAYIILVHTTLGILVSPASFNALQKKFIKKKKIKKINQALIKWCLQDFIILQAKKQAEKLLEQQNQLKQFSSTLKEHLHIEPAPQNRRKPQKQQVSKFDQQKQFQTKFQRKKFDKHFRNVTLRSDKLSQGMKSRVGTPIGWQTARSEIKMQPLHSARYFRFKNDDILVPNWQKIHYRRKMTTKKTHQFKFSTDFWAKKVKNMKQDSKLINNQKLEAKNLRHKHTQSATEIGKEINELSLKLASERASENQINIFSEQKFEVAHCQMGIVQKIMNFPKQIRKINKNNRVSYENVKKQYPKFLDECQKRTLGYREERIQDIFIENFPKVKLKIKKINTRKQ